jgi:DNA repair protein RadC
MAITNWPAAERPRERLLRHGAKHLSDAELLAIFIQTGTRGKTALDIARELLADFGSLKQLLNAAPQHLMAKNGLGEAKLAFLKAALELGHRYQSESFKIGADFNTSQAAKAFLASHLKNYAHEVFACLFLNVHHKLLSFEELFHGTINESSVYPREVVKRGLAHNAAKVILAHNHPSGNPTPSQADCDVTQLLKQSLTLVDIQVIDHIIIGHDENLSMMEAGYL